jgi:hypothetical protein
MAGSSWIRGFIVAVGAPAILAFGYFGVLELGGWTLLHGGGAGVRAVIDVFSHIPLSELSKIFGIFSMSVLLHYILVLFVKPWPLLWGIIINYACIIGAGMYNGWHLDGKIALILLIFAAGPSMIFDATVRVLSWMKVPLFSGTQADYLLTWGTRESPKGEQV